MIVLITGHAGFIGFHMAKKLLAMGITVIGIDNLNPYYDVQLKHDRLSELAPFENLTSYIADISDMAEMTKIFNKHKPTYIIHLAAQAGVRNSIDHPADYIQSNVVGFFNIMENAKNTKVKHMIYASSSSVYGANTETPFREDHTTDHPVSLYGATKKSNEILAHSYSHLYNIPMTGLRFFTVYGPWGRPDMALFKFTESIMNNKSIDVYNYGKMQRDFTYIDDITEGVFRLLDHYPESTGCGHRNARSNRSAVAPFTLYNIGRSKPEHLIDFIDALGKEIGKTVMKRFLPIQPGDVVCTYADSNNLFNEIDYKPETTIIEGIKSFVGWYKDYYGIKIEKAG